jgi:hypothetical protein
LDSPLSRAIGAILMALGAVAVTVFFFVFQVNVFSLVIAGVVILALAFKLLTALRRHGIRSIEDIRKRVEEVKAAGITTTGSRSDEHVITDSAAFRRHVERRRRVPAWLLGVFLIAGLGMTTGGVYLGMKRMEFLQSALTASGTVVDFNSKTSTSDGTTTTTYYPLVEFSPDSDHRRVKFEHDIGSSHPSYRRGDVVQVLYSPKDSSEAIIDEGWMNYFGSILMVALGMIFMIISVSMIRRQRQQNAAHQRLKLDF